MFMGIPKISVGRTIVGATLVGFVFFAFLFYFHFDAKKLGRGVVLSPNATPQVLDDQEVPDAPLPVRLKIPKIGVDALVEPVGLTPGGAMEAPRGGRNVGWLSSGTYPGDSGSAVIDGHFGPWKNGEGSVFDALNTLEKGDSIYVENGKGEQQRFVVREWRIFAPDADATDVFSSDDDGVHLNLITCEGVWNKETKRYSGRLVVFTDKEE
jgi:LPXTG-site transpeptidase (sortase) family protein